MKKEKDVSRAVSVRGVENQDTLLHPMSRIRMR